MLVPADTRPVLAFCASVSVAYYFKIIPTPFRYQLEVVDCPAPTGIITAEKVIISCEEVVLKTDTTYQMIKFYRRLDGQEMDST